MKEGQLIDYSIKILGKKIRWRTIITDYSPPEMFIDQQLLGPYSMWHHKHEFNIISNGVEVIDRIHYIVPYGILGRIVNSYFIKPDLNKIFDYRYKIIEKYFKGEGKR